jgi:hypothetical protein
MDHSDAYTSDEHLQQDVVRNLDTLDDLRILVDTWTDHYTSKLWRCFGCLTVRDCTERKTRRMFTIWSSMLERKAGVEKFRILTALETRQPCGVHSQDSSLRV